MFNYDKSARSLRYSNVIESAMIFLLLLIPEAQILQPPTGTDVLCSWHTVQNKGKWLCTVRETVYLQAILILLYILLVQCSSIRITAIIAIQFCTVHAVNPCLQKTLAINLSSRFFSFCQKLKPNTHQLLRKNQSIIFQYIYWYFFGLFSTYHVFMDYLSYLSTILRYHLGPSSKFHRLNIVLCTLEVVFFVVAELYYLSQQSCLKQ